MGNKNNCLTCDKKEKVEELCHIQKPNSSSFTPHNRASQTLSQTLYTPPPKTKMTQTLENGNIICGFLNRMTIDDGTILYVNGDKYTGAIWEGMAHGKGEIKYKNGDFYKGRFANDLKEGDGIFRFSNGNIYDGTFKKGLFDGQGIFRFINKSVYKGESLLFLKKK